MHDIIGIEARGVPGVFVASSEFGDAADAQARALGADPARVLVKHPIQDRTDEELQSLADGCIDSVLEALTLPQQQG